MISHIIFMLKAAGRYERIYVRYSQAYVPVIWILGLLFGNKIILEVNSLGSQYRKWFRVFDALFLSSVSNFLCVSDENLRQIRQLGYRFADKNIFVIPNGVSVSKIKKTPETAFTRNFCYVGVIKPGYGLEEMIASFMRTNFNYEKVTIIGDGPLLSYFKEKYSREVRIEFRGPLSWTKITEFVETQKPVLLYPSVGTFVFQSPIKLYEYMGLSLPILSQLSSNTRLLHKQLPYFTLIDLNSPSELDMGLERLFADPAKYLNNAYNGLQAVTRNHTWENRVGLMLQCLKP